MKVQDLVQKAVQEINEAAQGETEAKVKSLVSRIILTEASIIQQQRLVASYKKELQELQHPTPVSVEL